MGGIFDGGKSSTCKKPFITLVMAYYENPTMLQVHLKNWKETYPDDVKARMRVIIVDDGSPRNPAVNQVRSFALREGDLGRFHAFEIYRIDTNIPWNQDGARNLGMMVAHASPCCVSSDGKSNTMNTTNGTKNVEEAIRMIRNCRRTGGDANDGCWCIVTDMDHLVPSTSIRAAIDIIASNPNHFAVFEPQRRTIYEERPLKPHPNSYLIHTRAFWKVGGYDEALVGLYNIGNDTLFRKELFTSAASRIITATDYMTTADPRFVLLVCDKRVALDIDTKEESWREEDLRRKYGDQKENFIHKVLLERKDERGLPRDQKILLNFPWHLEYAFF
jgi:hypothetical protein